jgi:hypothetical protein
MCDVSNDSWGRVMESAGEDLIMQDWFLLHQRVKGFKEGLDDNKHV